MKIATGLFETSDDAKKAANALDRHGFVKDEVRLIDQDKVSTEDSTDGEKKALDYTLSSLGIPVEKVKSYTESVQQGAALIVVRTEPERLSEALKVMREANATETA